MTTSEKVKKVRHYSIWRGIFELREIINFTQTVFSLISNPWFLFNFEAYRRDIWKRGPYSKIRAFIYIKGALMQIWKSPCMSMFI